MKHIKVLLCFFFLCCFSITTLKAQSAIPASGGNASGSGGSASYTVGQIVYTTNTGSNGSEAQGVQQPYEISVITAVKDAGGISLEFVAYPNPASDFIKIKIEDYEVENLTYRLHDINGILLQTDKVEGNETTIPMNTLLPSIYFLKVFEGNKEIVTYKIIKN
ncbi:MAG: T9SS type A sorting domain-containing protein [Bacteroidota bacterium]